MPRRRIALCTQTFETEAEEADRRPRRHPIPTTNGPTMNRLHSFRRGPLALALAAALLAGCDAGEAVMPRGQSAAAEAASLNQTGQRLARAVAAAMGDAALREQVVSAMRASGHHEHKLVLQEFARAPGGQALLAGTAAAAGVSVGQVREWLAVLPPLDFYLPLGKHRRQWTGGADFVVGLNLQVDDPRLTGYRADGSTVQLNARQGAPAAAVIILHPAEPKRPRSAGPARGPGQSIEGGSAPIATNIQPCEVDCGGTGGSSGPVLYEYAAYVGDGWGDNEMMFKHYSYSGTKVWEFIHSGFSEFEVARPNVATVLGYTIKAWERDSGWWENSQDDYLGSTTQLAPSGQITRIWAACGSVHGGDVQDIWRGEQCGGTAEGYWTNIPTVDIIYRY